MTDQLAALALVIADLRLNISRQAAELQAAHARIAELEGTHGDV